MITGGHGTVDFPLFMVFYYYKTLVKTNKYKKEK